MAEYEADTLTSGRVLARSTVWNLLGLGAPLIVAVFTIPVLLRGLGTERFGLLTFVWMVLSYFGLLDLGLGRALTRQVAENSGADRKNVMPELVWTSLVIMTSLGVLGTVLMAFLSHWLVYSVIKVPHSLRIETLWTLYVLAAGLPFVLSTAGLRGVLEAHQCFKVINLVRIPMSAFTFLGPVIVLEVRNSLVLIAAALLLGRVITWGLYLYMCLSVMPALRTGIRARRAIIRPLLATGGWMTVSNIVSPLMGYLDRLVIGAVISVSAVAYYVTPNEMVTKLWQIPGALVGVLFPAFATTFAQDRRRTVLLFHRGVKLILIALFPIVLILVIFARQILTLWLGAEFALESTRVLQLLSVGILINSLAYVPFALVQGVGRSDLTAAVHLLELPLYYLALRAVVGRYGIDGVAGAWVGRMLLDTVLMFAMVAILLRASRPHILEIGLTAAAVVLTLMGAFLPSGYTVQVIFATVALLSFAVLAWSRLLGPKEKALLSRPFTR